MSRGKHDSEPVSAEWWTQLLDLLDSKGLGLAALNSLPACPSPRTLRRYRNCTEIPRKTFARLASALNLTRAALRSHLQAPERTRPALPLTVEESTRLDELCTALDRAGQYDDSARLGEETYSRAKSTNEQGLTAHWAYRCASAFRASGRLKKASFWYARAWKAVAAARLGSPTDAQLALQAAITRFGQVMVDDYMIRGAFRLAYDTHAQLLREADCMLADADAITLHAAVRERRPHLRRQQAEMLRLMGQYEAALSLIRTVTEEYPPAAFEERCWSRISEADSLRLLGRNPEALRIYDALEADARHRRLAGLLGATLLRRARVLTVEAFRDSAAKSANLAASRRCVDEALRLAEHTPDRYRRVMLYALLARASDPDATIQRVGELSETIVTRWKLSKTYMVLEWAHVALCRADAFRRRQRFDHARPLFKAAYDSYSRMQCNWGILRAGVGLELTGGRPNVPSEALEAAEGADRTLVDVWQRHGTLKEPLFSNWP